MGKNAKRRKEAKLQEKLKRAGAGHEHCHHEGCDHHHHYDPAASLLMPLQSAESLPAVFRHDEQEEITEKLIQELTKEKGFKLEDILQWQQLGMRYCRERNSFASAPQAFGNFH